MEIGFPNNGAAAEIGKGKDGKYPGKIPAKPAKPVKPAEPVMPTTPVEPVKPAKPAKKCPRKVKH